MIVLKKKFIFWTKKLGIYLICKGVFLMQNWLILLILLEKLPKFLISQSKEKKKNLDDIIYILKGKLGLWWLLNIVALR
jgi:hypothetical protein